MTGKIIDRETSGFLLLIIPLAIGLVIIFSAWQWILLLIIATMALKVWQDYRWSKLSARLNPTFARLMQEHQGCLTPLDLSLKTGLNPKTATEFLERKAGEFGAQKKTIAPQGTVYYFITASTLGLILDDSEPEIEPVKPLASSPAASFTPEEITTPEVEPSAVIAPAEAESPGEIALPDVDTTEEPVKSVSNLPEDALEVSSGDTGEEKEAEISSAALSAPENEPAVEEDKPLPTTNLGQLLQEADKENTVSTPEVSPPSETETDHIADSLGTFNQVELAKRLEVSTSTIGK